MQNSLSPLNRQIGTRNDISAEPEFRITRRLHARAVEIVENLKVQKSLLIDCLQEIDHHKVYRKLGYQSLFRYAVDGLGLSENQAYDFITVARKSVLLPKLKDSIQSREITVSKARRICSVIDDKNQMQWLEMAKSLPKEKLEKKIAKVAPRSIVPERARFVTDTLLELQLPMGEETYKKLQAVRELMCQSEGKHVSLEETIEKLSEFYLEKKDPVRKAERVLKRQASLGPGREEVAQTTLKTESASALMNRPQKKKNLDAPPTKNKTQKTKPPIPSQIKHQVINRDGGRCTYQLPNGERCRETRWLHMHHIQPRELGGADMLKNLTTLCSNHHRAIHETVVKFV